MRYLIDGMTSTTLRAALWCLVVAFCANCQKADAIDINITYDGSAPSEPELRPTGDPTASFLIAITNAAADYWEDIILDDATLDITIAWSNRGAGNNLANASAFCSATCSDRVISFNGFRNDWYFDSTPLLNSEFNLGFDASAFTRYQDTSAANQAAWFRGNVPGSLEIGASGGSNGSDPLVTGNIDLFTVALHEIGHHLGNFGSGESEDNFWDFNPSSIGGRNVGVTVASPGNQGHIAPNQSLMRPSFGPATRVLPTATDVLAIAGALDWTDISLNRKEFLSGTTWNSAANWIGNRIPSTTDDVYIDNDDSVATVDLTFTGRAANLRIGNQTWLRTQSFDLIVAPFGEGELIVENSGTALFAQTGGTIQSGSVTVRDEARINMSGGGLVATAEIETHSDGEIFGQGEVSFFGAGKLTNSGSLTANGGVLRFTALGAAMWDLDGSGPGELSAMTGDLEFVTGSLFDDFDGTISIGEDHFMSFPEVFTHSGTIDMFGSGGTATFTAPKLAITDGNLDVENGIGRVEGDLETGSSATISIGAGSRLEVTGVSTLGGGTFQGNGTYLPFDNVEVTGDTTIMSSVEVDLDGTTGAVNWTIRPGNTLTINSTVIEPAGDGYDGVLNVQTDATLRLPGTGLYIENQLTLSGGSLLEVADVLRVGPDATMNGFGVDVEATRILNDGQANFAGVAVVTENWQNNGTLDIDGISIGQISLDGDFDQSGSGALVHDIGGTAEIDFDVFSINGNATLDGELSVFLFDGFEPALGDEFRIIVSDALSGTFSDVNLPGLTGGLTWNIDYTASEVFLRIASIGTDVDFNDDGLFDCTDINLLTAEIAAGGSGPEFDLTGDGVVDLDDLDVWLSDAAVANGFSSSYRYGDANLDGVVDVSDFNVWNSNKLSSNSAWCSGNFNGDNSVDVSDFNLWNMNKLSSSDSSDSLRPVPEPGSSLMALLAACGLLARKRREH